MTSLIATIPAHLVGALAYLPVLLLVGMVVAARRPVAHTMGEVAAQCIGVLIPAFAILGALFVLA